MVERFTNMRLPRCTWPRLFGDPSVRATTTSLLPAPKHTRALYILARAQLTCIVYDKGIGFFEGGCPGVLLLTTLPRTTNARRNPPRLSI